MTSRFLQSNTDRTQIFALATGDGPDLGFGPLALPEVFADGYETPRPPWRPPGDPVLAADLIARESEFHPLDDYFHFYGYAPDVIAWIEATVANDPNARGADNAVGRKAEEVAERLGLDEQRLCHAGYLDGRAEGAFDPAGDPVFYYSFDGNWAVANQAGNVSIDVNSYRFKAWLSLEG